jgi:hypothetical protein
MENSFFNDEETDGGLARIINTRTTVPYIPDEVQKFKDTVLPREGFEGNYGYFIESYLEKVIPLVKSGEIKSKYDKYKALYGNTGNTMLDRIGENLTAISVAGEIVEYVFKDIGIENMNSFDIVKKTLSLLFLKP